MKKQILTLIVIAIFIGLSVSPATTGINIRQKQQNYNERKTQSTFENLFDFYIRTLMKIAHKPSISACIIDNNSIAWSKSYGYYDLENQKPATEDTLYLQASVSKTVTATALMQLYEQGLFDLDDDISDYLPFELRNPNHPDKPITIKMMLSHRSSLADDNLYWLCLSYLPGDPEVPSYPDPWLKEYLTPNGSAYSSTTWSYAEPGVEYYYANVGYSLIGYLVEILSNQTFNEYCKEHIFTPLQMYNSSFRLRDHNESNIAIPYEHKNGRYFAHPHYGIDVLHPAITLRTSVQEFSHFLIAFMNGGRWNNVTILNESTVELMHTEHFSPEDKNNYGLGWTIRDKDSGREIGHSGGYVGVHDLVTINEDENTAVIIFSNELDSELMAGFIERKAFNRINKALKFKASRIAS